VGAFNFFNSNSNLKFLSTTSCRRILMDLHRDTMQQFAAEWDKHPSKLAAEARF